MVNLILTGALLGLILSLTLGPVFFAIIQTSIDKGFKSAFQVSIGVLLSDFLLVFVSFLGISKFIENTDNQEYIAIIGGIVLILFGINTFFKKPDLLLKKSKNFNAKIKTPKQITYIAKGFLLNFLNPFLWIFWISAVTAISQQSHADDIEINMGFFFSGTLLTVFSIDIFKSYIGARIKKYLKLRTQFYINKIVGVSLIVFGIVLIVRIFII